jgi:hypothetical protein
MTRTELIIQILKVVIGLAFGAYFVWWSLEVLDRLTPEYDTPAAMAGHASLRSPVRRGPPWLCTLAFEHHKDRSPIGYEATREAAMAAFAKSWRREE